MTPRYGKTLRSYTTIKEYIETAEPGELAILTFPLMFEQSIRELLATHWGMDGYDYSMHKKTGDLGIVAFIPREHDPCKVCDTGNQEPDGD